MNNHSYTVPAFIRRTLSLLLIGLCLFSCNKAADVTHGHPSINNTSWKVDITVTGNSSTQNIFEFAKDGAYFSWHPAAAASYQGTWSQDEATVTFTFKETTTAGDYFWDNTGTLSANDSVLTGTMQRRGTQGSGTFTARRL